MGDSISDVESARAAGIRSIGYANRLPKVEALRQAGADLVIESTEPIARALAGRAVDDLGAEP